MSEKEHTDSAGVRVPCVSDKMPIPPKMTTDQKVASSTLAGCTIVLLGRNGVPLDPETGRFIPRNIPSAGLRAVAGRALRKVRREKWGTVEKQKASFARFRKRRLLRRYLG